MRTATQEHARQNASIVICGESGAGKTETTKLMLSYLSRVASAEAGSMSERVMETNPVLEAFGNAKTQRNHNSSRFGKLIKVFFKEHGQGWVIACASITSYLLEKSRAVRQPATERNFHIFYQLLRGLSQEDLARLHLLPGTDFRYCSRAACFHVEGIDDESDMRETLAALEGLGVAKARQQPILEVLAAILHLGNVEFEKFDERGGSEGSRVKDPAALSTAAAMLGLEVSALEQALTTRHLRTAQRLITTTNRPSEAAAARDAMAKALYSSTFDSIVASVNASLASQRRVQAKGGTGSLIPLQQLPSVGILDVFGLENMQENGFEQLFINYTNEKLQQVFNFVVFVREQAEYQAEGIPFEDFLLPDNTACMELLEGRGGLLALMNEECMLGARGSDMQLVAKMHKGLSKSPNYSSAGPSTKFRRSAQEFVIEHFAGPIIYSCQEFVEKNRDAIHSTLTECVCTSSKPFIAELLSSGSATAQNPSADDGSEYSSEAAGSSSAQASPVNTGSQTASRRSTLASRFKTALSTLVHDLERTSASFVRCIKTNSRLEPGRLEPLAVLTQLAYAGVIAALETRRSGFPSRLPYLHFGQRYELLARSLRDAIAARMLDTATLPQLRRQCESILQSPAIVKAGVLPGAYAFGRTRVFLKADVLSMLDRACNQLLSSAATLIQAQAKRRRQMKRYERLKAGTRCFQAIVRGVQVRQQHASRTAAMLRRRALAAAENDHKEAALTFQQLQQEAQQCGVEMFPQVVHAAAACQEALLMLRLDTQAGRDRLRLLKNPRSDEGADQRVSRTIEVSMGLPPPERFASLLSTCSASIGDLSRAVSESRQEQQNVERAATALQAALAEAGNVAMSLSQITLDLQLDEPCLGQQGAMEAVRSLNDMMQLAAEKLKGHQSGDKLRPISGHHRAEALEKAHSALMQQLEDAGRRVAAAQREVGMLALLVRRFDAARSRSELLLQEAPLREVSAQPSLASMMQEHMQLHEAAESAIELVATPGVLDKLRLLCHTAEPDDMRSEVSVPTDTWKGVRLAVEDLEHFLESSEAQLRRALQEASDLASARAGAAEVLRDNARKCLALIQATCDEGQRLEVAFSAAETKLEGSPEKLVDMLETSTSSTREEGVQALCKLSAWISKTKQAQHQVLEVPQAVTDLLGGPLHSGLHLPAVLPAPLRQVCADCMSALQAGSDELAHSTSVGRISNAWKPVYEALSTLEAQSRAWKVAMGLCIRKAQGTLSGDLARVRSRCHGLLGQVQQLNVACTLQLFEEDTEVLAEASCLARLCDSALQGADSMARAGFQVPSQLTESLTQLMKGIISDAEAKVHIVSRAMGEKRRLHTQLTWRAVHAMQAASECMSMVPGGVQAHLIPLERPLRKLSTALQAVDRCFFASDQSGAASGAAHVTLGASSPPLDVPALHLKRAHGKLSGKLDNLAGALQLQAADAVDGVRGGFSQLPHIQPATFQDTDSDSDSDSDYEVEITEKDGPLPSGVLALLLRSVQDRSPDKALEATEADADSLRDRSTSVGAKAPVSSAEEAVELLQEAVDLLEANVRQAADFSQQRTAEIEHQAALLTEAQATLDKSAELVTLLKQHEVTFSSQTAINKLETLVDSSRAALASTQRVVARFWHATPKCDRAEPEDDTMRIKDPEQASTLVMHVSGLVLSGAAAEQEIRHARTSHLRSRRRSRRGQATESTWSSLRAIPPTILGILPLSTLSTSVAAVIGLVADVEQSSLSAARQFAISSAREVAPQTKRAGRDQEETQRASALDVKRLHDVLDSLQSRCTCLHAEREQASEPVRGSTVLAKALHQSQKLLHEFAESLACCNIPASEACLDKVVRICEACEKSVDRAEMLHGLLVGRGHGQAPLQTGKSAGASISALRQAVERLHHMNLAIHTAALGCMRDAAKQLPQAAVPTLQDVPERITEHAMLHEALALSGIHAKELHSVLHGDQAMGSSAQADAFVRSMRGSEPDRELLYEALAGAVERGDRALECLSAWAEDVSHCLALPADASPAARHRALAAARCSVSGALSVCCELALCSRSCSAHELCRWLNKVLKCGFRDLCKIAETEIASCRSAMLYSKRVGERASFVEAAWNECNEALSHALEWDVTLSASKMAAVSPSSILHLWQRAQELHEEGLALEEYLQQVSPLVSQLARILSLIGRELHSICAQVKVEQLKPLEHLAARSSAMLQSCSLATLKDGATSRSAVEAGLKTLREGIPGEQEHEWSECALPEVELAVSDERGEAAGAEEAPQVDSVATAPVSIEEAARFLRSKQPPQAQARDKEHRGRVAKPTSGGSPGLGGFRLGQAMQRLRLVTTKARPPSAPETAQPSPSHAALTVIHASAKQVCEKAALVQEHVAEQHDSYNAASSRSSAVLDDPQVQRLVQETTDHLHQQLVVMPQRDATLDAFTEWVHAQRRRSSSSSLTWDQEGSSVSKLEESPADCTSSRRQALHSGASPRRSSVSPAKQRSKAAELARPRRPVDPEQVQSVRCHRRHVEEVRKSQSPRSTAKSKAAAAHVLMRMRRRRAVERLELGSDRGGQSGFIRRA